MKYKAKVIFKNERIVKGHIVKKLSPLAERILSEAEKIGYAVAEYDDGPESIQAREELKETVEATGGEVLIKNGRVFYVLDGYKITQ